MSPTPNQGGVYSSQLLGKGKPISFKGVIPGGVTQHLWMASYSWVYGQHRLDLESYKVK